MRLGDSCSSRQSPLRARILQRGAFWRPGFRSQLCLCSGVRLIERCPMLTIKKQTMAYAFSAIGLLLVGSARRADADDGLLPPNSTACTDQVRSNHGAIIYGRF